MKADLPKNWKILTVDQIKAQSNSAIAIGPFGSRMKAEVYVTEGIPVIRGTNISNTKEFTGEFVYISEEMAKSLKSSNVYNGDLVFPHRGSIGEVGIITGLKDSHYIISSSLMKLTTNTELVDPLFIFYYFRSEFGKHELLKNSSQVGTPGISTPLTSLKSLQVHIPPLPEQRAIAEVLGALDDKIELNRRMNVTLESMARAVFREWFVENPQIEGWQINKLAQHIEAEKGLSYKGEGLSKVTGLPMHNLNSIFEGGGYKHKGIKFYTGEYRERHVINAGDIIVANTEQGFEYLLIGYPAIVPKHFGSLGIFSHHLFRVRPLTNSPVRKYYLYFLLMHPFVREQIIGCTNGTTVNMLSVDGLRMPEFKLPPKELILKFEEYVEPLFEKMESLYEETITLGNLRDTLLPKLMSGQVRVKIDEEIS